jgi:hypothetical protein
MQPSVQIGRSKYLTIGCHIFRDLRNIFSHLEEYAYGVGQLQRSRIPLSVKCGSSNIAVAEDPNVRFELDLPAVKLAMDDIRECLIEIFAYFEP